MQEAIKTGEPRTKAEYRALIDAMLAELKEINKRIDANNDEIRRNRVRARARRAKTRAVLESIGVRLD